MLTALNFDGFNQNDAIKMETFLLKLLKHVNVENLVICGGLAIRHHLKSNNVPFDYQRGFNDIDFLLKNLSDVKPTITQDLLIYHYHDYSGKIGHADDFYISVIDEDTKIKADIYSYKPYTPIEPEKIRFKEYELLLRNPNDQLATQLLEVAGIYKGNNVDPKWLDNINALSVIAKMDKVGSDYNRKLGLTGSEDVRQIINDLKNYLVSHPEQLVRKSNKRTPYECDLCESKSGFEITPMSQIYKVLGFN